jgi:hypothetical protein
MMATRSQLISIAAHHRTIKSQRHPVVPEQFAERLRLLGASRNAQALREAETLLTDTVQLVQARTDADIRSFCEELSQRRRPVDPPTAAHRSAAPQRTVRARHRRPCRRSGQRP